ncbi:molecular chaperone-like protein [Methylobacterium sp. A54F]
MIPAGARRAPADPVPPMPRAFPLLALALLAAVACGALALWFSGLTGTAQDQAGGKPPVAACDPPGQQKPGPRPPECPQAAPPNARSP